MSEPSLKLVSDEGNYFDTTLKAGLLSGTIKDMIEALGECDTLEIPVLNLSEPTIRRVVEWINHSKDDPQPTTEEIRDKTADTIDPWSEEFLSKIDVLSLYELITAANYLNIPGLLWLTTRAVAYMIKGKTPEEVRNLFEIDNDWTTEELEQVMRENQWCEEK